jgi:acyl-CoA synthetase (AMP-forming)/AMP-acid ligase II
MTTIATALDGAQGFLDNLIHADRPPAPGPRLSAVTEQLQQLDLTPGTPVLVAMPNDAEFITVVFALLAVGAVPVPVTPAAPPARLRQLATALGAGAVVSPRITPELQGNNRRYPIAGIGELVVVHDTDVLQHTPGDIILLTSGTSGVFSGCLHRFDSLLRNAARHADAIGQRDTDTVLINLPMYFSYAFVAQMLATLLVGGRAVVSGPPFARRSYISAIQEHGVRLSALTPAVVKSISRTGLELPGQLRIVTVGGAALDPAFVAEVVRRNPALQVYLTYGLTEAGPRVATLAAHREPAQRYSSVGLPLSGVRVRLEETDSSGVGELIVDTDTAMVRRVGNLDTPKALTDRPGTTIRTGDLFSMDSDGYLFFRGRLPKYIVSRGEKVCLQSVRAITEQFPGVIAARAWAEKDSSGETVFALDVYISDTAPVTEPAIRRHLVEHLLRAEWPARIMLHLASSLGWAKSVSTS